MKKKYERIFTLNDQTAPRINPALACEIGLNESIILLQIEYWISISNNFYDGQKWTYQSLRDMKENVFRFWSISTINRAINSLIKSGYLIEGNYNKYKYDKTRWFALGFKKLSQLKSISIKEYETGVCQNDTGSIQNDTRLNQNDTTIPESTTEITTKTSKTIMESPKETQDVPMYFYEFDFTDNDKKEIVSYYMEMYEHHTGQSHPKLKPSQWERVDDGLNKIDNVELGMEYTPDVDIWKDIIDQHFTTNYDSCDYNILHFIEDGIKVRRMYEAGYQ